MSETLPEPDAEARAHSERLETMLHEEIAAQGPMPFSRFMERCLYAPGLGYYSAGSSKLGAAGDFVTAPGLGNLFARCVASHLTRTLRELGPDAEVLELGGGDGAFAADALTAMDAAGVLPRRYAILEPSADLCQRQRQHIEATLKPELAARVQWLDRPPETAWQGVVFANEVVDALPTTRFCVRDGEVYEEHVEVDDGALVRCDRPADELVRGAVHHLQRHIGRELEDGYRSEVLPQLPYWLQAVAGGLEAGMVLFIDYGHPRSAFYLPERHAGTLRAHYRHRVHGDPLFLPGLQDLTASVDFTALAEAGHHAGFELAAYTSQAQLLIAGELEQAFAADHAASADARQRHELAQQVKWLTMPDGMGEEFQAMALTRGMDSQAVAAELTANDLSGRL